MKKLSQTEVSSLLNRRNSQTEVQTQPAGMTLDQFYISLGKAAKKDLEAGIITNATFVERVAELGQQYRSLKASR